MTRSPHAREPEHPSLERQARPTRSSSGTPKHLSRSSQIEGYQLLEAPLLSREDEQALARDIEALELEHWGALLSYPPALPTLVQAVAECLPEPCPTLQRLADESSKPKALGSAARKALASELRQLDAERTALRETDARVRSVWQSQARAREYLARVDHARAAQQAAKARFVASNLRLVVRMARAYDHGLLDKADLIQEGNIGLMRAVERFDYRRGLRFSTYAGWWIRHHLNRGLADKGRLIRVPVHAVEAHRRVLQAQRKYITRYGVAPSTDELIDLTGLAREAIEQTSLLQLSAPKSLDVPVQKDMTRTLHDVLADETQPNVESSMLQAAREQALAASLQHLSTFEAAVLRFRYGLDGGEALTLREVGEKYNLSRERIRQVQEVALAKLRLALAERDDVQQSAVA